MMVRDEWVSIEADTPRGSSLSRFLGSMFGTRRRRSDPSRFRGFYSQGFSLQRFWHSDPGAGSNAPDNTSSADIQRADIVSLESAEDNARDICERDEDNARFDLRMAFIKAHAEFIRQHEWPGSSSPPTPLQMRTINDSFFRIMRSSVRRDFFKLFPFGVVNSALSAKTVSSLVAAQVLIDMALMDDDPHSLALPFVPGTRVTVDNCPPQSRHLYFSFMAFKFTDVRLHPDALRDLAVLYFYHLEDAHSIGDRTSLRSLTNALQPLVASAYFQESTAQFYLEVVEAEKEFRLASGEADRESSYSTTIGFKFQRGALLGSGSSGDVYSCYRVPGDHMYALKVISLSSSRCDNERVVRGEIAMLHRLRHPRIISYYGCYFDRERGECGIMMEHAPQTLRSRIAETNGLPLFTIAKIARQLLEGLSYLHANHIIHQDIKSANILLDSARSVKLGDLGAAAIGEVSNRRMVGTPLFMAPEVCRFARASEASDMWGFGCTLIELATGGLPWGNAFKDLTSVQIMYQIASASHPPSLPEGHPVVRDELFMDFFSRCVSLDPLDRPSAASLLTHPFLMKEWESNDLDGYTCPLAQSEFETSELAVATDDDSEESSSSASCT